jgi:hypothetical protein
VPVDRTRLTLFNLSPNQLACESGFARQDNGGFYATMCVCCTIVISAAGRAVCVSIDLTVSSLVARRMRQGQFAIASKSVV